MINNEDNYLTSRSTSDKNFISIPGYYFYDDEDKVVVDEECMVEEFKEKLKKVSSILNGRKKDEY